MPTAVMPEHIISRSYVSVCPSSHMVTTWPKTTDGHVPMYVRS